MKYNANLNSRQADAPHEAGKGKIEILREIENIAWQTRGEAPSDYELALTDALEQIFGSGLNTLPDIITALNERRVLAPDGTSWTEELFQIEIKNLGTPFE